MRIIQSNESHSRVVLGVLQNFPVVLGYWDIGGVVQVDGGHLALLVGVLEDIMGTSVY